MSINLMTAHAATVGFGILCFVLQTKYNPSHQYVSAQVQKVGVIPALAFQTRISENNLLPLVEKITQLGFVICHIVKEDAGKGIIRVIFSLALSQSLQLKISSKCVHMMALLPEHTQLGRNVRIVQRSIAFLQDNEINIEQVNILHEYFDPREFKKMGRDHGTRSNEIFGRKIATLMVWMDYCTGSILYGCFFWIISALAGALYVDAVIGIVHPFWSNARVEYWKHAKTKYTQSTCGVIDEGVDPPSHADRMERFNPVWTFAMRLVSSAITSIIFAVQLVIAFIFEILSEITSQSLVTDLVYYIASLMIVRCIDKATIAWRVRIENHVSEKDILASRVYKRFFSRMGIFFARLTQLIVLSRSMMYIEINLTVILVAHVILCDSIETIVDYILDPVTPKWHPDVAVQCTARVPTVAVPVGESSGALTAVGGNDDALASVDDSVLSDWVPLDHSGDSLLRECSLSHFDADDHYTNLVTTLSLRACFQSLVPLSAPLFAIALWRQRSIMWSELLYSTRRPAMNDDNSMSPWFSLLEKMNVFAVIFNVGLIYFFHSDDRSGVAAATGTTGWTHKQVIVSLFFVEHILLFLHLIVIPQIIATYVGYEFEIVSATSRLLERGEALLAFCSLHVLQNFDSTSLLSGSSSSSGFGIGIAAVGNSGKDSVGSISAAESLYEQIAEFATTDFALLAASSIHCQRWTKLQSLAIQHILQFKGTPFRYVFLSLLPYACSTLFSIPWWCTTLPMVLLAAAKNNKTLRDKKVAALSIVADPGTLELLLKELPPFPHDNNTQRCEWLNLALKFTWPSLAQYASSKIKTALDPIMENKKPSFIQSLNFSKLQLGTVPPTIMGIRILEHQPGAAVSEFVELEVDFSWSSNLDTAVSIKVLGGAEFIVDVSNFQAAGTVRVILHPLVPKIPPFGIAKVTFYKPPKIDFDLNFSDTDLMDEGEGKDYSGGIKHTITRVLRKILETIVNYPKWLQIKMDHSIKEHVDLFTINPPEGILCVRVVSCKDLVVGDLMSSDPYVVVSVLEETYRTDVVVSNLNPKFEEEDFTFLVNDATEQFLHVEVWDKDFGSVGTHLGMVDIYLKDLPINEMRSGSYDLIDTKHGSIQLEMQYILLEKHGATKAKSKSAYTGKSPVGAGLGTHSAGVEDSIFERSLLDETLPPSTQGNSSALTSFLFQVDAFCEEELLKKNALVPVDLEDSSVVTSNAEGKTSKMTRMNLLRSIVGGRLNPLRELFAVHSFFGANIVGAITISKITLVGVKSVATMLSSAHYYAAYVTVGLGKALKRKTSVMKTDVEAQYKEEFHLVVASHDDSCSIKIKYISTFNSHHVLATVDINLDSFWQTPIQHHNVEIRELSPDKSAVGHIHFDMQFRQAQKKLNHSIAR